jgi:hypothetical protein
MSQNNFWRKYSLFLLLTVLFTHAGQSSTITVTPSEAQSQIQAAINNSHTGDTIYFQAGTFKLQQLRLAAGRTYLGSTSGQTIVHWGGGSAVMVFYGSGITVQHFIFDGGGLYLGGAISNVNVEYNTFQNIAFGPNGSSEFNNWPSTIGVFLDTSATHTDISHNTFHNLSSQILSEFRDWNLGVTAIFGYNLSNMTINYNTFDTVNEGIHFFAGKNVQIDHNSFSHVHRIAMEVQDNVSDLEIGYNEITQPLYPFWVTFGISNAITGGGSNIHDNLVDDQVPEACGANCYVGYGIETWGNGSTVVNNTIQGYWGNGVAIGPSSNLHVTGNHICGPEMAKPPSGYVVNQQNTKWRGEVIANNTTSTSTVCAK